MRLERCRKWIAMALVMGCVIAAVSNANVGALAMVIDRTYPLVNTFVPSEADQLMLAIPIKKQVVSSSVKETDPSGFIFTLTEDGNLIQSAQSDRNGNAQMVLSYLPQDAGKTFHYQLAEVNDHRLGFLYSTVVYSLEIEIVSTDSGLTTRLWVDEKPVDSFTAVFENVYAGSVPLPLTGDSSRPFMYGMLACLSGILLAYLLYTGRKLRCDKIIDRTNRTEGSGANGT